MTRIDNLGDLNAFRAIWKAIDQLSQKNDLQHAAIGRGGITVYGGGVITIENGGLSVTGYAEITGQLRGDGTLIWTGPWAFTGSGEITGDVDLTGNLEVLDDGRIVAGNVRIEDGKIHIGGMILDPTDHGGSVKFPNGAEVFTDGDTIQLVKGNSVVQVSDEYARLQNGGNVVQLDGDGVRVSPAAVGMAAAGETVTSLGINGSGRLRRIPTT